MQIKPYKDDGVVSIDRCGGYTFKKEATKSVKRKEWVHISQLTTYMFQPPGSEMSEAVRKTHPYVKVIPVVKAFVRD